ncbi:hypothetical protein FNV43_RR00694 [Rhamnella rubrinervis]|uniref:Uncharacterized protein n=1 Tax=Rhamnella rubrinervis TaxID=2594499 RepID=A0A8K0MRE3_9ROSA|nr:hypothetical protein FNV43_RR00694 [Rhamnella rubrinervis]
MMHRQRTEYDLCLNAPGRFSDYVGNCGAGDSVVEPYIVAFINLLLAHSAVEVYKEKYQAFAALIYSDYPKTMQAIVGNRLSKFTKSESDSLKREGVNVKAYYAWSFLDDFEWASDYTVRYGLTYVDFKNNFERHIKYSVYWLKMFLLK